MCSAQETRLFGEQRTEEQGGQPRPGEGGRKSGLEESAVGFCLAGQSKQCGREDEGKL